MTSSSLPYQGIRIVELSKLLAGRLAGLLFADQGAEVLVERDPTVKPKAEDEYFDRNKFAVPSGLLSAVPTADVVIVDGETKVNRQPGQITLRVVAALPGDEAYGHLKADCSEDLLNALVGFYTNMAQTGPLLGRPCIYTPLPLCSVYAGVIGAVATAAALADRERCGKGREVTTSRLAGGLSAIGALCLITTGLPEHLQSPPPALPKGLEMESFEKYVKEAAADADKQLWFEQRLIGPLASPFRCADDKFIYPVGAVNRRLCVRILKHVGVYDEAVKSLGLVDLSIYEPENFKYLGRNLADPMDLDWDVRDKLCDLLTEAFKKKPAAQWEKELCSEVGAPAVRLLSWHEWRADKAARDARLWADVQGHSHPQIGRVAWLAKAQKYPDHKAVKKLAAVPKRDITLPAPRGEVAKRPLEGFTLIDMCDVIAGPSCGRMWAELGCTVIKVDPTVPLHTPLVMLTWQGETCAGKHSMILDAKTPEGHKILHSLVAKADVILNNKLYPQWERLGMDVDTLKKVNPKIVVLEVTGHNGKKIGGRTNYPGYDPILQALTGIMDRFGPVGCPTMHGEASCVDYLCGYCGAWSGMSALVGTLRRNDGTVDWAATSLAAAGTLTQLLLQQVDEPASARGPFATNMVRFRW